ncbi:MAG: metallophosphoesterase family protein [Bacteroidetes bacterium]|nr:metallophosphoesterase family protein [Bacteroidota bacterium]
MTKIGLISDTHSYMEPRALEILRDVDEIWHAGDIGDMAVADALAALRPLRAVYGNIDGKDIRYRFAQDERFYVEGLQILMTHIGGYPGAYAPRAKKLLAQKTPDIFVCGHSHILKVMRDPAYNNMLVLNPGAAGVHGFHQVKTLLRFTLDAGKVTQMEAVEMGKRGAIK